MAVTRLQEKYLSEAVKGLMDKFNYTNVNELPKVEKIVINIGCGDAVTNSKAIDSAVADLTVITGQKPVITKAKKSIAAFKLREGMPIGTKVTLRGERMYQFLDKLMNIALPRVRDFRGVNPKSFDGRGNYSMGFTKTAEGKIVAAGGKVEVI
jgi:Ribosomal protein L5